jgi:hypothetical protein
MKRIGLSTILLVLCSGAGLAGQSESMPLTWNRAFAVRSFVELSIARDTFRGDLDGQLALGTTEKVFYVPALDPGPGFQLSFGRTMKGGLWKVGIARSVHDAVFRGTPTTAYFNAIEVSGKGYLLKKSPVLPYLEIGFGPSWIHVTGAAERDGIIYDANYIGLSVRAGGGLLIPVSRRVFLTGGASYHFMAGMYAKGPGRGRDVTNLYVDRTGPRRDIFLKIPGVRIEIGVGWFLH